MILNQCQLICVTNHLVTTLHQTFDDLVSRGLINIHPKDTMAGAICRVVQIDLVWEASGFIFARLIPKSFSYPLGKHLGKKLDRLAFVWESANALQGGDPGAKSWKQNVVIDIYALEAGKRKLATICVNYFLARSNPQRNPARPRCSRNVDGFTVPSQVWSRPAKLR